MDLGAKNNVYRFNPGKAIPIFLPLRQHFAMLFNGKSHIVFQNEGDLELLRQMPERADIKQFLKV